MKPRYVSEFKLTLRSLKGAPPRVVSATGVPVARMADYGFANSDGIRMVNCWNACAGINPNILPELLSAVRRVLQTTSYDAMYDLADEIKEIMPRLEKST